MRKIDLPTNNDDVFGTPSEIRTLFFRTEFQSKREDLFSKRKVQKNNAVRHQRLKWNCFTFENGSVYEIVKKSLLRRGGTRLNYPKITV